MRVNKHMERYMNEMGSKAKVASNAFSTIGTKKKNKLISDIGENLDKNRQKILDANKIDFKNAEIKSLNSASLDRLLLNKERMDAMIASIHSVVGLEDPIGEVIEKWERPNGLLISKVSVPLGVIGIIYESRPNVTSDAAVLCLKSGNAVILRGGSESINTNIAIHESISDALIKNEIDANTVQLVKDTDRKAVDMMLSGLDGAIDILVPRGGKNLVQKVKLEARVPIIGHLEGICHVYIQNSSNLEDAIKIVINSKMRRTGICGAAETVLIDRDCIDSHLEAIIKALKESGCEIRGDDEICKFDTDIIEATEEDWVTEYLDSVISIKVVEDIKDAVKHINHYGSGHTESIITKENQSIEYFFNHINSAIILSNASTQFADGGEFGMGAEIGISTDKIHARGPVGSKQLTSYKFLVNGNGQIRGA